MKDERKTKRQLVAELEEMRQQVAELRGRLRLLEGEDIAERERAEQLLYALNVAALAMRRALTPREIFTAVAKEFKKLGFHCTVFLMDKGQSKLFAKYLSYETRALKAAEKLTGLKAEGFAIPIKATDIYREVVWGERTVFVEDVESHIRQMLPEPAKRFTRQIARLLKIPRLIIAPLVVADRVIGMFTVQSDDLVEADVPSVTAFAYQMAAAWHKAQLLKQAQQEIIERLQAESQRDATRESLRRRDEILQAVAFGAEQLLRLPDLETGIPEALARLGAAAAASRAYIFENHADERGRPLTSQRYEWTAPGVTPQIDAPELQDLALIESGFGRWVEMLGQGQVLHGPVREFPPSEREVLEAREIQSMVVMPIFVAEAWWGFIGFDECPVEREWSAAEINALKAAADALGAAIQRKQVEDTLQESEEQLELAIAGSNGGRWHIRLDPDDPLQALPDEIYISPRLKGFLGYEDDEFPNSMAAWESRIVPEDLTVLRESSRNHRAGRTDLHEVEYRIRHKDDSIRWLHTRGRVQRDERGRPAIFAGIDWDITERIRAEEELRKFKTISDRAGYGMAMADLEGSLLYLNESFAEMHGQLPEELIGRNLSVLHNQEQMENVARLIKQLQEEDNYVAEEVWHMRKDGTVFPTLMNGTLVRDKRGTPLFMVATAIDISERVQAEEALRESETRFRALSDATFEGVAFTEQGIVVDANQQFADLLGYEMSELQGMRVRNLVAPEDREFVQSRILSGSEEPYEHRALCKDGAIIVVEIRPRMM
jgi:PAS domain S-box-containing protein